MDARERRKRRERRERIERAKEAAKPKAAPKRKRALVQGDSPRRSKSAPLSQAPYRINAPVARKMGIDEGLRSALDDFSSKSRERLRKAVAEPLAHIEPVALRALEIIKPKPVADRRLDPKKQKLAKEFAKEPERVKSDPPRDKITCKPRPKTNRSKSGGGGKKRFIPWCS